jgi:hypothetical protein
MRSRAAFLPLTGDPIVATFWWKFFINVWQDEVDFLYVRIDAITPVYIADYIRNLFNHPKVIIVPGVGRGHGVALQDLINASHETYNMLTEEDAYIFKKGAVNEQFANLENGKYDFIGSSRDSAAKEIVDAENLKFGIDPTTQLFDIGPNFWPNFVFTGNELFRKTDINFDSKNWKAGDVIKEIDLTLKEDANMDTFGWMSIQIRTLTNKIGYIPQFKAYPIDPFLARNKEWTFSGLAKWIHAGSMSSGVTRYLRDENGAPLFIPGQKFTIGDFDHEDFVLRCAWWGIALTKTGTILSQIGLHEFVEKYSQAIHRLMDEAGITEKELQERMELYKNLLGTSYV